jgi:hypothetical protein
MIESTLSFSYQQNKLGNLYALIGNDRDAIKKQLNQFFATVFSLDGGASHPKLNDHPDLLWLEKTANKKEYSLSNLSPLSFFLETKPLESDRKFVIFENAQDLGLSVSNKLLKALEDTPEYLTIFLITSHKEGLIQTLQSRSQFLRLGEPKAEQVITPEELATSDFVQLNSDEKKSHLSSLIEGLKSSTNDYHQLAQIMHIAQRVQSNLSLNNDLAGEFMALKELEKSLRLSF